MKTFFSFLFILILYDLTRGPKHLLPPTSSGERDEPRRARPQTPQTRLSRG